MTRHEAMPPDALPHARKAVGILGARTSDAEYVESAMTAIGALTFIEYLATGARPKTDTVQ